MVKLVSCINVSKWESLCCTKNYVGAFSPLGRVISSLYRRIYCAQSHRKET